MKGSTISFRLVAAAVLFVSYTTVCEAQLPANTEPDKAELTATVSEPPNDITVPAGTKVMMALISPLHTVSATSESSLYLETIFDVVVDNRVVIPSHAHVQGLVTRVARPGRVKGRGQFQFAFTRLILPNHYVAQIAGHLQSLPGSTLYERKRNQAIQPVDQIDTDLKRIVGFAATGSAIGAISAASGGAIIGSLLGGGFGLGATLIARGDDIRLPESTRMEMTLDQPVTIPASQLTSKFQQDNRVSATNSSLPVSRSLPASSR